MNSSTASEADNTWDSIFSELEGIEADLTDFLDPDHFESEVLIDEQGQFLNWLEGEARLASQPLPSMEAPTLTPVSADFLGFTEKSGFGVSSVRTSSPLESLNNKMGLESQALGVSRSESLGLAEGDLKELEALSEPKADTGFAAPQAAPAVEAEEDMPDIPMLDLMDAIAPKKAANTQAAVAAQETAEMAAMANLEPTLETPETFLEPVVAPVAAPVVVPVAAPVLTEPTTAIQTAPQVAHISNSVALYSTTTMRRYFDITDLLEAQTKLIEVLAMPQVPLVVFLGRAAERCSSNLANINSIAIAEARDEGLVNIHTISAHESFRKVLLEINESQADAAADLTVADLSDLELDEVSLPVTTPHLLLTRISADPERPGRMRGTLTLTGTVGLKSGAAFLKAVVTRLESPITLML